MKYKNTKLNIPSPLLCLERWLILFALATGLSASLRARFRRAASVESLWEPDAQSEALASLDV